MTVHAFTRLGILAGVFSLAACGDSKIVDANASMRRQIASDVTVTIDAASQQLYEPAGDFYYVCGQGVVNQPGLTDHESQRFIIFTNKQARSGLTMFDGRKDQDGKAAFQKQWDSKCK